MQLKFVRSSLSGLIVLSYVLSVAALSASYRTHYEIPILSEAAVFFYVSGMASAAGFFYLRNSSLIAFWLGLAGILAIFASSGCLIEAGIFGSYINLAKEACGRLAFGCFLVFLFFGAYGTLLWRYRKTGFRIQYLTDDRTTQMLWAIAAMVLSFCGLATFNDLIYPLNNYDLRCAIYIFLFVATFVLPWTWIWLMIRGRTPLIFDASIAWLFGMLVTSALLRCRWLPWLYDQSMWCMLHIPFLFISYLALKYLTRSGRDLKFAVALLATILVLVLSLLVGTVEN